MSLGLFFIFLSWTKNHSDQSTNLMVGQASWILWLKAAKRIRTLVYIFPRSVITLRNQRIYQWEELPICPPAYVKSCFKERCLLGFFPLRSLISQWLQRTISFPKRRYNETEDEGENFFFHFVLILVPEIFSPMNHTYNSNKNWIFSHRKEWNNAICSSMNANRDYHTKWSKPEKDKNVIWYHLYVES